MSQYTHCGRIVASAIMYTKLILNARVRFPQLTTTTTILLGRLALFLFLQCGEKPEIITENLQVISSILIKDMIKKILFMW